MAIATYAQIAEATYSDALSRSIALRDDIKKLVSEPTMLHNLGDKLACLEAHIPYLQSEVYRFYGGPIDGECGPEGMMNAWPLDEAYIDYVEGDPSAGIIADAERYPRLTPDVLA